jgi:oxygen-independent coproporphyrinogen-3 oxidase
MSEMPAHLYVHVPFCDGKCHYCGFFSVVAAPSVIELYSGLPADEFDRRRTAFPQLGSAPLRTVYMGGGTPAMLGCDGMKRLAHSLAERLPFDAVEEWTVELNPVSASADFLRALSSLGVNRLSIGVQSFDDDTLARVGRRHTAEEACAAVKRAQDAGFANTGIDLIAGLPGVTPALWAETLERALTLNLTHLSVYALTLEPDTPLAAQAAAGLVLPDDAAQLSALAQAEDLLGRGGFARYEISNYARPGYECRHNLGVWRGNDYLGLGPAAASRIGRARWTNSEDLEEYIASFSRKTDLPGTFETLTEQDDATERALFALRLAEGIDPAADAQRFSELHAQAERWENRLAELARHGITERGGRRWRLTARGREVCDAVLRELV